ncbi:MAG: hypothetical protein WCW13_02295 [archaeon]|jgi:hypothetical protein
MAKLSVAKINLENARKMRSNLFKHAENWHGWSGENYRARWKSARRFFVGFKPVLFKAKKGTFVVDACATVHDSPYGIRLAVSDNKKLVNLMVARLSFEGKEVTIRAIQGEPIVDEKGYHVSRTNLGALREFEKQNGKAANFLFNELKKQAKELGYSKLLLLKPQNTASYISAMITETWRKRFDKLRKEYGSESSEPSRIIMREIRERMAKFYQEIADTEKLVDKGEHWEVTL